MKEAIEILYRALPHVVNARNNYQNKHIELDATVIIEEIKKIIWPSKYYTWQPSPDTEYKITLTKWIEKKKWFETYERIKETDAIHKDNPYSFFESWQKICPRTTEEGEG